jgi:hypothetical protein
MILTYLKHRKSHSYQNMGPERDFYEGRQRTKKTPTEINGRLIKLNTKMIKFVSGVRK